MCVCSPTQPGGGDARAPHVGQRTPCAHRQRVPGSGAHPQPPAFFWRFTSQVAKNKGGEGRTVRAREGDAEPTDWINRTAPPLPMRKPRTGFTAPARSTFRVGVAEPTHWINRHAPHLSPRPQVWAGVQARSLERLGANMSYA